MKYINSFDFLRAFAVILVLFRHGSHLDILKPLVSFAWTGVDLFFVISGYLISTLLIKDFNKHGEIRFFHFYTRRIFKIWPSYYLLLIVWGLIYSRHHPEQMLWNFIHVQNYFNDHIAMTHTWSLSVEEHFYLILPLIIYFWLRARKITLHNITIAWTIVFLTCLALRLITAWRTQGINYDPMTILTPTHLRFDSLFTGVSIGLTSSINIDFKKYQNTIVKLLIFFVILCMPLTAYDIGYNWLILPIYCSIVQITYGLLLIVCIINDDKFIVKKSLFIKIITSIGRSSYNIYLWHWFVMAVLDNPKIRYYISNESMWFLSYMTTSIIVGICMTKIIEIPFLKMRDRVIPS